MNLLSTSCTPMAPVTAWNHTGSMVAEVPMNGQRRAVELLDLGEVGGVGRAERLGEDHVGVAWPSIAVTSVR